MTLRALGAWSTLLLFSFPRGSGAEEPSSAAPPAPTWSLDATLAFYVVPDQTNFLQPVILADRGPVHLEARYNYESLRTASFLVGWTFAFGSRVTLTVTPLFGCMAGEIGGPIVGLELFLGWGPLSFSSQGEWVFDLVGGSDPYAYVWSEIDVKPWEWFRFGVAMQRTKLFHTPREVIYGPLVGFSFWKLDLAAYWFRAGGTNTSFVVSAGLRF